jgi:hypothetical protein
MVSLLVILVLVAISLLRKVVATFKVAASQTMTGKLSWVCFQWMIHITNSRKNTYNKAIKIAARNSRDLWLTL